MAARKTAAKKKKPASKRAAAKKGAANKPPAKPNGILWFPTRQARDDASQTLRARGISTKRWQDLTRERAGKDSFFLTSTNKNVPSWHMNEVLLGVSNPANPARVATRKPTGKAADDHWTAKNLYRLMRERPQYDKFTPAQRAQIAFDRYDNAAERIGYAWTPQERSARKKRFMQTWKQQAEKDSRTRKTPPARKNAETRTPAEMYELFHGTAPRRVMRVETSHEYSDKVADCGKLIALDVYIGADKKPTRLESKGNTRVWTTTDGGQLYFHAGDQRLDLTTLGLAEQLPKDHVEVGAVKTIHYYTTKDFHDFSPTVYYHEFGEAGGTLPTLGYDTKNKTIYLTGGTYQVKREGITN